MTWKAVRLELADTEAFPSGSASRSYLLNVPLDDLGEIETGELVRHPQRATFRRFWPSEPDENGQVVKDGTVWIFRCERAKEGTSRFRLGSCEFRLGEQVIIHDLSGDTLPFRVAGIRGLGARPLPSSQSADG